jgi:CHAD domain-containing protein
MALALAGFIAERSDERSWDEVLSAVLSALETEFNIVAEPAAAPGHRRRTWLDTFDWRLHKAGLVLSYLTASRVGELLLAGRDGETRQQVTGWQASRAHPLPDLPDGPVTSRIAGLIAPRALLPMVAIVTTVTQYRLLNDDEKTVARMLVESPALAGPGLTAALPPRLSVTEVRGYQAQARRAARLVAAAPGVIPATHTPLADALSALGRRPGDYSNKVGAAISAAMPAPRAAATILLRLLDTIEANVEGVLKDIDTEFLHDLRVSVRRSRSALKLFGDVLTAHALQAAPDAPGGPDAADTGSVMLSAEELAFFTAEFKWVGDLTTPVRDLDVHLLDFDATAHGLEAAKPDDLEPFRGYLEQRRRREFRTLVRGLRSPRFTTLMTTWRARLVRIGQETAGRTRAATPRSPAHEKSAWGTAGLLAAERTRVAFVKVAKRGAAINPDSPPESLHNLRKRCKELRYALEFFAPLYDPAGYSMVVGDLKRLQDCLGEFQDTEVQIAEIRALAAGMLAAGEAPAVTLLAMGEVTAGLKTRQRAARTDFEQRFAAFADVNGRRRMSALLRGGTAP